NPPSGDSISAGLVAGDPLAVALMPRLERPRSLLSVGDAFQDKNLVICGRHEPAPLEALDRRVVSLLFSRGEAHLRCDIRPHLAEAPYGLQQVGRGGRRGAGRYLRVAFLESVFKTVPLAVIQRDDRILAFQPEHAVVAFEHLPSGSGLSCCRL